MDPLPRQPSLVAFALELHSAQPERLVSFYEKVLNAKFIETTYPFRRYATELGRLAFIITDARGADADSASKPGAATLSLLTPDKRATETGRYFLHPQRPLAGTIPNRRAARLKDPDGNYVALVMSMEEVLGRLAPIPSWRMLFRYAKQLVLARSQMLGKRLRWPIDAQLDRYEYLTNGVTFLRRDIRGYSHVVTSRGGLLVINRKSYKRVLRGAFFGLTVKDGDIYCFQSCSGGEMSNRGRVLRLRINGHRIDDVQVVAKGLDDGCHQMDFVGDDLFIVDSCNGRILQMRPDSGEYEAHLPLGPLSRRVAMDDIHMNSLMGHPDGTMWVLLHNSNRKPSEVIVLNARFEVIRRFSVDAGCAHNIVFTNDELEYLIADSSGGRIMSAQGPVVDNATMLFRGLSLTPSSCVVGESFFSTRPCRRFVPGCVHFFDRRSWALKSSIRLPVAPTDIRRIDGRDLSLSNYFAAFVKSISDGREAVPIGATSDRLVS